MKDLMKKMSVSLGLSICELLLGILLLVNPVGLTSGVIIVLGIALTALGGIQIYRYIRLPLQDAVKTWKLAIGLGLGAVGLSGIANQHWLVTILGTLTTLYGAMILVSAFMKLQMAIDALRMKRNVWYLMGISFVLSAALATILFIQPFATEKTLWIFMGIALIVTAVLDCVYYFLGRKK